MTYCEHHRYDGLHIPSSIELVGHAFYEIASVIKIHIHIRHT